MGYEGVPRSRPGTAELLMRNGTCYIIGRLLQEVQLRSAQNGASSWPDNYLRQKPLSFQPLSFLLGNIMMATGCHYIIQHGRHRDKPAIFLTQPVYKPLKLPIHSVLIKALAKMCIHNTCAVFCL